LKQFHTDLYHPSNATFLSYGDLNFTKHLKEINETTLSKFTKRQINSKITLASNFDAPVNYEQDYQPELVSDPES